MLRLGIVVDSYVAEAWIAKVVDDIQTSDFARIEFVVLRAADANDRPASRRSPRYFWKHFLFNYYQAWDYRRFKSEPDALAPTDLSQRLHAIPSVKVNSVLDGSNHSTTVEHIRAIQQFDLDVLLWFGDSPVDRALLGIARYGIWSLRLGDIAEHHRGPVLFREIYEKKPVSKSVLQAFKSDGESCQIIDCGYSATTWRSLYLNRNPAYWKAATCLIRRLRELHRDGAQRLEAHEADQGNGSDCPPGFEVPSASQMAKFLGGQIAERVSEKAAVWVKPQQWHWFVAFRPITPQARFDDPAGYRPIIAPQDRFYADPFLFDHDGKTFLFVEDYRLAEGKAVISCAELGPSGILGTPVEVLRHTYHLSYPFVFDHAGEVYMIPESSGNRSVDLYRAVRFPYEWKLECSLLRGLNASDATVHISDGKFWMFVALAEGSYSKCDELALFSADSLAGPWLRHPSSPVVCDVRRARPAGRLFQEGGRLIRPSQDCSQTYGHGLVFSEVLLLNQSGYREVPIGRIDPQWLPGNTGTHHYTRSAHYEAIDGYRRLRSYGFNS